MLRSLLILLVLAALFQSGGAFDSYSIAGGKVHQGIDGQALEQLAPESLELVDRGNRTQDKFYLTEHFMDPARHFTDDQVRGGLEFVRSTREKVVEEAAAAPRDYAAWRRALFHVGGLLHAVQDFYAHSNYVEIKLARGEPLELVDWDNLPEGLTTAYFLATTVPPSELEDPGHYEEVFGREFADMKGLRDEEAVRYAATRRVAFTHSQLGKDSPEEPHASRRFRGTTLFDAARNLAVKETRRQWAWLRQALQERHGDRAEAILASLQDGWFHDLAGGPAGETRNRRLELSIDNQLDTRCRLVLEPAHPNRDALEQAVKQALAFTPERVVPDESVALLRKDGRLELSFVADPYDLQQGLGRLELGADGTVRLELAASFEEVLVEVDGRVAETDGTKAAPGQVTFASPGYLVYRPDGELNPPDWVRR